MTGRHFVILLNVFLFSQDRHIHTPVLSPVISPYADGVQNHSSNVTVL